MGQSRSLEERFENLNQDDLGIIGSPVEHSLSPVMQNAALKLWRNAFVDQEKAAPTYHKVHVNPEELPKALEIIRQKKIRGVNVTVPHKVSVCKLVDKKDPSIDDFGAINTLLNSGGEIHGLNTDAYGFRKALSHDLEFDPQHKKCLILGAGGTARVMAAELIHMGASEINIWNRSPDKLKNIQSWFPKAKELKPLYSTEEVDSVALEADFIANATSVGLADKDPLPLSNLSFHSHHNVFDVVYHRDTMFLQLAREAGATAVGGLGMLLYQGAKSFEIWTKSPAPVEVMKLALLDQINLQNRNSKG